ncbi:ABC-2 transporter permease [Clostridium sp. HV4-5-A1G]|uniref:ABC-2 transporter permease n=1 Tax=Clostridium sp. HV4-5-A1G TaxID=2004595 RepID=UPI00123A9170|nr:ABC-2 transporter permease [Clostridium sp. HV4-5-A1G]KAA8674515.1 ABC-2 transporter permease [Clostridium sp. HV4-5-A1G]
MLFHLIKKDFLLAKRYVVIMLFMSAAIPLFILWRAPVFTGLVSFLSTVIFTELILYQYISLAEAKYPEVDALLCAAPYTRSSIVEAKYAFFLVVFIICFIVYSVLAFFIPQIGKLDLRTVLSVFLFCAIPYGVYMPFQFKYGYEKTKFAFILIIMLVSFGIPLIYNANISVDISAFSNMAAIAQYILLITAAVLVLGISMMISINIYMKKEL